MQKKPTNLFFQDVYALGWTLACDSVQPLEDATLRPRGKQDDEAASVSKDSARL
jgi:hypothetical protein